MASLKDSLGKISFVGAPAVGKSTIMKMLTNKLAGRQYMPTQGFDLGSISFKGFKLRMWDFGGQKAYLKHYLTQYIHGSDIVFIVTDSTPKNVLTTKELVAHARSLLPKDACNIYCLANKQDLSGQGHMKPAQVKNVLHIPTFGISAIDPDQRDLLINFISEAMNIITEERENI